MTTETTAAQQIAFLEAISGEGSEQQIVNPALKWAMDAGYATMKTRAGRSAGGRLTALVQITEAGLDALDTLLNVENESAELQQGMTLTDESMLALVEMAEPGVNSIIVGSDTHAYESLMAAGLIEQLDDTSYKPIPTYKITAAGRQYVEAHPFDVDAAVRRIAAKDEQQTVKRSRRSEHEIAELKASWLGDPCWDIEDTEGFEAHHDELEAYHQEQRKLWNEASDTKLKTRAQELGCTPELAAYIQRLEQRIAILEQAMIEIESKG